MSGCILIAGLQSFKALIIPWLYVYPAGSICWIFWGKMKAKAPLIKYLATVTKSALPACFILFVVKVSAFLIKFYEINRQLNTLFMYEVVTSVFLYLSFLYFFRKEKIKVFLKIKKE